LLAVVFLLLITTVIALTLAYQQAVSERNWALTELDGVRAEAASARESEKRAQEALRRVLSRVPLPGRQEGDQPEDEASRRVRRRALGVERYTSRLGPAAADEQ
jgi:hypothetical protein